MGGILVVVGRRRRGRDDDRDIFLDVVVAERVSSMNITQ